MGRNPTIIPVAIVWFFVSLLLLNHVERGRAQRIPDATPTAAPQKTTVPTLQPTRSATLDALIFPLTPPVHEPFTQADLDLLTGNVLRPNGLIWHNDNLYSACTGDSTIYEVDDTTGRTITYSAGIQNSHTIFAEDAPDGQLHLWVPDFERSTLFHITPNRAVRAITTALDGPWGITPLDDHRFLITNLMGSTVSLVDRDGEAREVINGLRSPTGITTDAENIYIANTGSARRAIEWLPKTRLPADGAQPDGNTAQPLVSGLQNTTGLVYGSDGFLYFAYALGTRGIIGRVNPAVCRQSGGCTNAQVEIVVFTELEAPLAGLTLSPDMRLFIHTMFDSKIYRVDLDGRQAL